MKKEGKYAVFEYEKQDENLIDELIKYLDYKAGDIYKVFNVKFENKKMHYKIFPTKKELDEFYKQCHNIDKNENVPNWIVGFANERNIFMISYDDYKNVENHKNDSFDYYKKTFVHEFVHSVNRKYMKINNCDWTARYLGEGIACYLSGQYEGRKVKLDCSLDDLLEDKYVYYYNYNFLTKYLVENYDKDFVLSLMKSKNKARAFLKDELYDKVNKDNVKTK